MTDPRARNFVVERPGYYLDTITGARFDHDGSNAGRTAASLLAEQSASNEIKVYDRLARRPVTLREIQLQTIAHPEDRTDRELRDAKVKVTTNAEHKVERRNPHLAVAEWHESQLEREKESPRQAMARQAREKAKAWDAKEKASTERAELQARPDVAEAIEDARTILRRLRMTDGVPVRELEQAEARLKLAEAGDVAKYDEQTKAYKAERRAAFREMTMAIDAEAAETRQAEKDLLGEALNEDQ